MRQAGLPALKGEAEPAAFLASEEGRCPSPGCGMAVNLECPVRARRHEQEGLPLQELTGTISSFCPTSIHRSLPHFPFFANQRLKRARLQSKFHHLTSDLPCSSVGSCVPCLCGQRLGDPGLRVRSASVVPETRRGVITVPPETLSEGPLWEHLRAKATDDVLPKPCK